jgi:hypothetical protein
MVSKEFKQQIEGYGLTTAHMPGMRHPDRVQGTVELALPELEEAGEDGEARREVALGRQSASHPEKDLRHTRRFHGLEGVQAADRGLRPSSSGNDR